MGVVPVFLSTVTPGKLPVRWFNPVSTLNNDVFPLLGLPTNAIWTVFLTTMGFAKVACGNGNHLRDQKFCVKGNEKKPMKKMNVFHAKPLQESIFAVRYKINSKGITGEKRKASCFTRKLFLLFTFEFFLH